MILPTKAMATQELTVKRKLSGNTLQVQASSPVALGVRIPTVALHMMELFDTTVEQLYSIFTVKDEERVCFIFLEFPLSFQLTNKIIMKWRCRNWSEEHYAMVALNFVPTLGQTELQLKEFLSKQHFEEIKGLLQLTPLNG
uniref:Uncharacterized protein n=1 Tax=Gorilla gorilla gorilla TaxID=9595 RepID=A0A2I2ZG99_GORGO